MFASWPSRLRASPEIFPLDFAAPEIVDVIALTPADYERASFLDAARTKPVLGQLPYTDLAAAAAELPLACDYIFHVGHVGSTLVSRLLGRHPQVFSLREPQALRSFAEAHRRQAPWQPAEFDRRLSVFLTLYSRTWTPEQRSLVKATSLVSGIAPRMLALEPGSRALLMTTAPETYLATVIGGANSQADLVPAAPGRAARLARRLGIEAWDTASLSLGEIAALTFACEMTALAEAGRSRPERVCWIDFEAFLADPREGLAAALRHLRRGVDSATVERLVGSGYLERYSKAPEYAYGPEVRRQVLDAARREAGAEIRQGLTWLETLAADHQTVAAALEIASGARHVA